MRAKRMGVFVGNDWKDTQPADIERDVKELLDSTGPTPFYAYMNLIEDRRSWESMHLGTWSHTAKYKREEIEKMLRRGEISETRAHEMLCEVTDDAL